MRQHFNRLATFAKRLFLKPTPVELGKMSVEPKDVDVPLRVIEGRRVSSNKPGKAKRLTLKQAKRLRDMQKRSRRVNR